MRVLLILMAGLTLSGCVAMPYGERGGRMPYGERGDRDQHNDRAYHGGNGNDHEYGRRVWR